MTSPQKTTKRFMQPTLSATKKKTRQFTYSMDKSILKTSQAAQSRPGPGSYGVPVNNPTRPRPPSAIMLGKSKNVRFAPENMEHTMNPAPGQYRTDSPLAKTKSAKYSQSKSERKDIWYESVLNATHTPAIGVYNRKDTFQQNKNRTFTIGKKVQTNYNRNPSPDKYQPDQTKTKVTEKTAKISREARKDIWEKQVQHAKETPSGMSYKHADTFTSNKNKTFTIGSAFKTEYNANPGPGEYDNVVSASATKSSPAKFSVSKAQRQDPFIEHRSRAAELPEAGQYEHRDTFTANKSKTFTIGTAFKTEYNANPGPGAYAGNQAQTITTEQNFKIGQDTRKDIWEDELKRSKELPEAAQYSAIDTFAANKNKTFTIGTAFKTEYNANPGPGEYDLSLNATKPKEAKYVISKDARKDIWEDQLKVSRENPEAAQYGHVDTFSANKSKTFTIGTAFKTEYNANPGPGEYTGNQAETRTTEQNFKIAQDSRKDIWEDQLKVSRENPEAAQYGHVDTFSANKNKTFTIGSAFKTEYNANPGPGEYTVNQAETRTTEQNFKIGQDTRKDIWIDEKRRAAELPEAGQYEHKDTFAANKGKTFTIGTAFKTEYNANPGPGEYTVNQAVTRTTEQNFKIGQDTRKDIWIDEKKRAAELPEAGQYEHRDTFEANKGKTFTIGTAFKTEYNANPGPGEYTVNQAETRTTEQNFKIGQDTRKDIWIDEKKRAAELPEAGQYEHIDTFAANKAKTFTIGSAFKTEYNSNPGPGEYTVNQAVTRTTEQNFKIGQDTRKDIWIDEKKRAAELPEAGQYEHIDTFAANKAKTFTIGTAFKTEYNANPGPGEYTVNQAETRTTEQNFKIGQDTRKDIWIDEKRRAAELPEVGQYEHKDTFAANKAKTFTIGTAFKTEYNSNPGPGEYTVNQAETRTTEQNFKIGQDTRKDIWIDEKKRAAELPEAGQYEHKDTFAANKAKTFTIGTAFKTEYNTNPGPGEYTVNQAETRTTEQNFKISQDARKDIWQDQLKVSRENPEAAQYAHKDTFEANKAKTFTIGSAFKTKYNENPGPGEYTGNQAETRTTEQNFKIGQDTRKDIWIDEKRRAAELPEAGQYDHIDTFAANKAKTFTIGTAFKTEYNANPGPGEYTVNQAETRTTEQNFKIGQDIRKDIWIDEKRRAAELPEVGQYEHRDTFAANKGNTFTIGSAFKTKYNENPGPGEYTKNQAVTVTTEQNFKISQDTRKDIWIDEKRRAAELPEAGQYEHIDTFAANKAKTFTIGTAFKTEYNANPGPGEYTVNQAETRTSEQNFKIGQDTRKDIWIDEKRRAAELPEAGQYEHRDTFEANKGKTFTIGSAFKTEYNSNPGPGEYTVNQAETRTTEQNFKIGQDARKDIWADQLKRSNELPEAAQYDHRDTFEQNKSKSFTIGRAFTHEYNQNPGPGEYTVNQAETRTTEQNFKIGQDARKDIWQDQLRVSSENPETAQYDHRDTFEQNKSHSFTIGKAFTHKYNENPGPGYYEPGNQADIQGSASQSIVPHPLAPRDTFEFMRPTF